MQLRQPEPGLNNPSLFTVSYIAIEVTYRALLLEVFSVWLYSNDN